MNAAVDTTKPSIKYFRMRTKISTISKEPLILKVLLYMNRNFFPFLEDIGRHHFYLKIEDAR
jgi:hypothetical protein